MPVSSARKYLAKLFHKKPSSGRPNVRYTPTADITAEKPVEVSNIIARLHTSEPLLQQLGHAASPPAKSPSSHYARPSHRPEHQATARNRYQLDQAVPKALQYSQTSVDLQCVPRSTEAGRLPFCEDVAQRNVNARRARSLSQFISPGPRTSSLNRCSPSKPHGRFGGTGAYTTSPKPDPRRGHHSLGDVYLPPLRSDGRRRSLSHKADISDLRTASGHGRHCESWQSPDMGRSVSEQSQLELDKPLPPTPSQSLVPSASIAWSTGFLRNPSDRRSGGQYELPKIRPWSAPDVRVDSTTLYEIWQPAVTHETIRRDIHEVREEHVHKDTHHYHVRHKIQPIIDYEILPPRHFVHLEGGGCTEVSEADLPAGTPNAAWLSTEIRSQLEASDAVAVTNGAWPVELSSSSWEDNFKYRFFSHDNGDEDLF